MDRVRESTSNSKYNQVTSVRSSQFSVISTANTLTNIQTESSQNNNAAVSNNASAIFHHYCDKYAYFQFSVLVVEFFYNGKRRNSTRVGNTADVVQLLLNAGVERARTAVLQ